MAPPDEPRRRSLLHQNAADSQLPTSANDKQAAEEAAAQRKKQRLQARRSFLATDSPRDRTRGQSHASPGPQSKLSHQQLKDHYQTCIQLSTSNKIDTKNAFGLHLIDYMATLIKASDEVNFKLATTALDAGTKIYVSRVDCVHTDVTKVANSIVQALDSKSKKNANDESDEDAAAEEAHNDQDAGDENVTKKTKAKRSQKRKAGSKVAPNQESLNIAKVETNVEIDPIFHKLTTSHDMGNVNSLFLANLKVDSSSALVLDSNAETDLKPDPTTFSYSAEPASLQEFGKQLKDLVEKEYRLLDDKFFMNFRFNREDGNCETEYNRFDDDLGTQKTRNSAFTFDLNADVDEDEEQAPVDFNLSQQNDIFDELGRDSDVDSVDEEMRQVAGDNYHSIMQAVNMESLPDLRQLLNEDSDEYTYFKNKIVGSWAGPGYWKPNQFLKNKHLRELVPSRFALSGNVPATASKKQKKQFDEINFVTEEVESLRSSSNSKLLVKTLEKWGQSCETSVLPDFLQFEPEELLRPFNKTTAFFGMIGRKSTSNAASSQDKRDTDFSVAASLDGMDGMDCAQDDDFPATQSDEMPFSQQTATQETVQGFTGANLVDEPDAIRQIDLPFAKYAKRMDVKKLKRAMLDLISNPSLNDSLPPTGVAQEAIRFSDLYQELPAKITPTMTKDMSPPIAFVTLLHLANENNLVLENSGSTCLATERDMLSQLKDIIIKKE